jgi:3-oxoacyl-[acyl-carrier protein] reductase
MSNAPTLVVCGASAELAVAAIKAIAPKYKTVICQTRKSTDLLLEAATKFRNIEIIENSFASNIDIDNLSKDILAKSNSVNGLLFFGSPPLKYEHFKKLNASDLSSHLLIQAQMPALIVKNLLPSLQKHNENLCKIVFTLSSVILNNPPKNMIPYVVGKYAALGLMKALAAELVTKDIRVNAIAPSMFESHFLKDVPAKILEMSAESHPLKRNLRIDEIVPSIEYLLSTSANAINGVCLPIDFGI